MASGRYGNVSEVVSAALQFLEQQDARRAAFVETLDRAVREAGEKGWLTADEVEAESER